MASNKADPKPKKSLSTQEMRKLLFTPCATREHFSRWIQTFLGIEFPNCTVVAESTSNPLELMWTIYSKAIANNDVSFSRAMSYASRFSYKTLGASVLEVMVVLHTCRNVAHMAAIGSQSAKAQEYVRSFFSRSYLRDFRVGQNVEKIDVARFYSPTTGLYINEKEWLVLTEAEKVTYERTDTYIQIVMCTMQGANSAHVELMVVDEIDVVPTDKRPAYEEAKHIPSPRNGLNPITLLTSTRKISYGLVQSELDLAGKTGLHVFHWNILDVTEACEPERHLPGEPKVKAWVDDNELTSITDDLYQTLDDPSKSKYVEVEGFAGCIGCKLFPACKGQLATNQHSTSKLLYEIPWVINHFKEISPAHAQTQMLCRRPDETGLIYPHLDKDRHFKTAAQIAEMVTGVPHPDITKQDLLRLLVQNDAKFTAGMDFGFNHPFAVVTSANWGQLAFVVDVIAKAGLELDDKIALCQKIKWLDPKIYGDPEEPAAVKTFKRRGFRMQTWSKYKGSVKAGIETCRMKLRPAAGDPTCYFLADDPGVEGLFQQLKKYHFLTDIAGQVSDEPDKIDDDQADAFRYDIMNTFAPKGKPGMPTEGESPAPALDSEVNQDRMTPGSDRGWMQEFMDIIKSDPEYAGAPLKLKKGGFGFIG